MVKDGFINLLFPEICLACETELSASEHHICYTCWESIHLTYFEGFKEPSSLDKLFWGRVNFEATYALFYFQKGKASQKLLHALKYHNNPEIALFLGKYYGTFLKEFIVKNGIEAVVAIPLHKNKLRMRGYNQSEMLCNGMAETLGIDNLSTQIIRTKFTETQTKKSRLERSENVNKVFEITNSAIFENKHILIIDDVITTGATIESCANELTQIANCKVSIGALAFAYNGV